MEMRYTAAKIAEMRNDVSAGRAKSRAVAATIFNMFRKDNLTVPQCRAAIAELEKLVDKEEREILRSSGIS